MRKLFGINKRVLAVLLSIALVGTSFQGMSLTAYAEEDITAEEVITEQEAQTR